MSQGRALGFSSAAILTLAAVLRTGLGFALTVLAVKALGAEGFGRYSLVMAYGNALLYSYSGAYPVVITRLVQTRRLSDEVRDRTQADLVAAAALITLPGMVLLILVGAAVGLGVARDGLLSEVARPITLIVVCQLLTVFGSAVLEGFGRMKTIAVLPLLGVGALSMWLAIAVLARRSVGLSAFLDAAVIAFSVEALVVVLLLVWQCRHLRPGRQSFSAAGALVREGFNLQAAKVLSFAVEPAVKSILNHFVGPASIAVYDFANRAATGMQAIFGAYSRLFLQIDREASAERMASTRQAADYLWAMYLYVAGVVAVVVMAPAARWMHLDALVLGAGYSIATLSNWLMVVGTPLFLSLIGFGELRFVLRNQLILAVVTTACTALCVPLIGALGAFVGTLLAMLINLPLIERRYRSHETSYRSAWDQMQAMRARLFTAGVLAIVPGVLLALTEDFRAYWGITGVAVVLLAIGIAREPLARATLRRAWTLLCRHVPGLARSH